MILRTKCVPCMNAEVSTLTDKSGSGYSGTVANATWGDNALGGKNLVFVAGDADNTVDYGDIGFAWGVGIWVYLPDVTTDQGIWQSKDTTATEGLQVATGSLSCAGWASCNIFVDGADTNTVAIGTHYIEVVGAAIETMSGFTIGLVNATYLSGTVYGWTAFNYARTQEQITQEYNAHKNDY